MPRSNLISKKIVVINNYPTPYRDDLFEYLLHDDRIEIVYAATAEDRRVSIGWVGSRLDSDRVHQLCDTAIKAHASSQRLIVPLKTGRKLFALKPSLVVCTFSRDAVLLQVVCAIYSWLFRARIIFWVGDVPVRRKVGFAARVIDWIRFWSARSATGFIFYSALSKRWVVSKGVSLDGKANWTGGQVRNALASSSSTPIRQSSTGLTLLFVGGGDPRKGLSTLVSDLGQISSKFEGGIELWIAGEGSPGKVEGPVRTVALGKLDASEMHSKYAAADVVVLASEDEPWGFIFNESISAGTPCVTSDRAGSSTVAREAGLAYEIGKPETLLAALDNALNFRAETLLEITELLSVEKAGASFYKLADSVLSDDAITIEDY